MTRTEFEEQVFQITKDLQELNTIMSIVNNILNINISNEEFNFIVNNINIPGNQLWTNVIKPSLVEEEAIEETLPGDMFSDTKEQETKINEDEDDDEEEDTDEDEEEQVEINKTLGEEPFKMSLSDSLKKIGKKYE